MQLSREAGEKDKKIRRRLKRIAGCGWFFFYWRRCREVINLSGRLPGTRRFFCLSEREGWFFWEGGIWFRVIVWAGMGMIMNAALIGGGTMREDWRD